MKMTYTKTLIAAVTASAMIAGTASGDLYVSESFDYSAGTINGTDQAGGTGLTGAWSGTTSNVPYSINTSAIDVSGINGLTASAGNLMRNTAPGSAQISRGLDATAISNLTADNSTIYFSIVLENNGFSHGNANGAFIIGTQAVTNADDKPVSMAGGEGFGVSVLVGTNPTNSLDIYGLGIDGGTTSKSVDFINTDVAAGNPGNTFFIVGKIDWVANGGLDTLTLYNVTDLNAPLPAAFATITADIDNSNIDTLAFADAQITAFDEIRIGTSLTDVGVVPEPGSLALLGLGGLLIGTRRRRA